MRVGVVGAGIGGLAAAHELVRLGHEAVVFEGSAEIGGKLRTGSVGGEQVDLGAEAVLARRPEAVELIDAVGLGARRVSPVTTSSSVWTHDSLRALPPTVLGMPADLSALTASGIVTELVPDAVPVPGEDISVADYVVARAGREVLDRLVEPLLGGVYAGRADALSLRAAAPQLAALGPDPIEAAVTARAAAAPGGRPVFAGIEGGIGTLPQAVVASGDLTVHTGRTVRLVERRGDGWRLAAGPVGAVEIHDVDAVVLATPAPATARLVAEVAPRAAFALAAVEYASVVLVTVVLDEAVGLPGSGFLVPPVDHRFIKAATFSSNKWAWVGRESGRTVLRASVGRAGEQHTLHVTDADLVTAVLADLQATVGPLPVPADTHVQRWGGALPQYAVGHLDRVATVRDAVAEVPGLEVCGAAYDGVGVAAVVAGARAAARRLHHDSEQGSDQT